MANGYNPADQTVTMNMLMGVEQVVTRSLIERMWANRACHPVPIFIVVGKAAIEAYEKDQRIDGQFNGLFGIERFDSGGKEK